MRYSLRTADTVVFLISALGLTSPMLCPFMNIARVWSVWLITRIGISGSQAKLVPIKTTSNNKRKVINNVLFLRTFISLAYILFSSTKATRNQTNHSLKNQLLEPNFIGYEVLSWLSLPLLKINIFLSTSGNSVKCTFVTLACWKTSFTRRVTTLVASWTRKISLPSHLLSSK